MTDHPAFIFNDVMLELKRARAKHPNNDVWVALAALTEEVGELNQAILQKHFEPEKGITYDDIRNEAIQVITVALRVLCDCGLDRESGE